MKMSTPFCVFCGKRSGDLKDFVSKTLDKCTDILLIRKSRNLHSTNVILLKELNNYQKYHSKCYSNFTAVPKKYKISSVEPTASTPSTSTKM